MSEDGYCILLWDGFGAGLVMLNARLHEEGTDLYGNPTNWWPCGKDDTNEELAARHALPEGTRYRVIRDG